MGDDRFEGHQALPHPDEPVEHLGNLDRAKRSSAVSGSEAITASDSERPDTYGNGCPGPTASGVRIG